MVVRSWASASGVTSLLTINSCSVRSGICTAGTDGTEVTGSKTSGQGRKAAPADAGLSSRGVRPPVKGAGAQSLANG